MRSRSAHQNLKHQEMLPVHVAAERNTNTVAAHLISEQKRKTHPKKCESPLMM